MKLNEPKKAKIRVPQFPAAGGWCLFEQGYQQFTGIDPQPEKALWVQCLQGCQGNMHISACIIHIYDQSFKTLFYLTHIHNHTVLCESVWSTE